MTLTVGGVARRLTGATELDPAAVPGLGPGGPRRADPSGVPGADRGGLRGGGPDGVLGGGLGPQRRGGALLCQVDGTTCGPTVLTVLAAAADPGWLGTAEPAFGARFAAAQPTVHRQANRCWPRSLGTTPFGLVGWLRRYAPAAGRHRIRWVDDTSPTDLAAALAAVSAAARSGRPVPLMVGGWLPRHWVLVLGGTGRDWRVYEPSSGQIRLLDPDLLRDRRAGAVLGWPRLHAALLADAVA